jgi:hypothetical protein
MAGKVLSSLEISRRVTESLTARRAEWKFIHYLISWQGKFIHNFHLGTLSLVSSLKEELI